MLEGNRIMNTESKIIADDLVPIHTSIENVLLDGKSVVRITKRDKTEMPDENTFAALKGVTFHNGTIEARILSRLLPDAPSYARGFAGIVFRAAEDGSEFEGFYVRPTNGRECTDPERRAHGCQYFSYPGYTFKYFREFGITQYEAPVDIALNEWFTLRAVIRDESAYFYLNENNLPVLTVSSLKHGNNSNGKIGIFVDIGTEAFVSDLKVIKED